MKAYIGKEYVQLYLDYLTHCGADVEHSQWMRNHKDKVNSGETVPFFLIRELRLEFKDITDNPMFPFELGYHLGENLRTYLDYSLKSCSNVEEIAELSTTYHFMRSNIITPKYKVIDNQIEFEIFNEFEDNEFWVPLLFSTAALTYRFFCMLFGENHGHLFSLSVSDSKPAHFGDIEDKIPFAIRFNSLRNCIYMDSSCLQLSNPAEDPGLKTLLLQSLKQQSDQRQASKSYRYRIREIMETEAPNYPNQEQVAERLNLSKRTLARKLQSENSSFTKLLDEVRMEQAERYLAQGLTISEISNRLGYESSASFINLFKKHTGRTPTEYRKE